MCSVNALRIEAGNLANGSFVICASMRITSAERAASVLHRKQDEVLWAIKVRQSLSCVFLSYSAYIRFNILRNLKLMKTLLRINVL